jgi:hypothetical protein
LASWLMLLSASSATVTMTDFDFLTITVLPVHKSSGQLTEPYRCG